MSNESIDLDWWTNRTPEQRAADLETPAGQELKAVFARHDALTTLQAAEKVKATCESDLKAITDKRAELDRSMLESERAQILVLKNAQDAVENARTALADAEAVLLRFKPPVAASATAAPAAAPDAPASIGEAQHAAT